MHIRSRRCYKGSGVLFVRIVADGATNVLEIDHIERIDLLNSTSILSSSSAAAAVATANLHINIHFPFGIGISVVGSIGYQAEELIYILISNLQIEFNDDNYQRLIQAKIETLTVSLISI